MTLTANDFTVIQGSAADISAFNQSLAYLTQSTNATAVLQGIINKGTLIYLDDTGDDSYDPNLNAIYWDPSVAHSIIDSDGNIIGVQSASIAFIHEGAHSTDPNGPNDSNTPNSQYGNDAEAYAVGQEDLAAEDLGETQRFNHDAGDDVLEANPTEHTVVNADGTETWQQYNADGTTTTEGTYQTGTAPAAAPTSLSFGQAYGEIGEALGSALGRILAGNDAFVQIGASTVLGVLGQDAGIILSAATTSDAPDLTIVINNLISGNAILQSVAGAGAGAVTAYLLGELLNDIGLTGAPAQVVESLAGATVSQSLT